MVIVYRRPPTREPGKVDPFSKPAMKTLCVFSSETLFICFLFMLCSSFSAENSRPHVHAAAFPRIEQTSRQKPQVKLSFIIIKQFNM